MRRKLLLLSLCLVFTLVLAQTAFAWGGGSRGFTADNWVNMADLLGLTEDQAQNVRNIQQEAFTAQQDLRSRLHQMNFELRTMRWQPGVDQTQAEAKIQELNELRSQMDEQRQQYREQMLSQFSDQQLAEMMRNGGGQRGGWRR
ncbi:MAG: periplasmic heavy metal sensor [Clostridia bacterium]|nr:periplasmic heavy metal sensor [Clostridia bacterium]